MRLFGRHVGYRSEHGSLLRCREIGRGQVRAWRVLLIELCQAGAGTLFVIPTAGEIPLVQTVITYGLGAGPAGALLATLPAVSLPSLLMVSRSFPTRVLLFVAGSVWLLDILTGLAAVAFGF